MRRVSVKREVGVYLFLKDAVLGLGLGLTLTLTLTLTLNLNLNNPNPNHNHDPKTAFSKKMIDPDPGPAFYCHPFAKRIVEEAKPNPHGDFFLPKSALFCDKISDVMIFGRPLFQWIEGEVDLIEMRYVHAV